MLNIEQSDKKYQTSAHLVYSCQYHVIFCPKYRRKILINEIYDRLVEIFSETADKHQFQIIEQEIMPDHVHLLLEVDPQLGVYLITKRIKGRSSRILRKEFKWLCSRLPTLWTNSYFVSSIGGAPMQIVKQYVERQKHV